jgi:hypothetical protein
MLASWSRRVTRISSPGPNVRASERLMCRCERGHVVAENDLLRAGGVQEVGHRGVGLVQDGIGFSAGLERAFMIGVALQQIALDAFGRLPGDLRPAGVVEEDSRAVE